LAWRLSSGCFADGRVEPPVRGEVGMRRSHPLYSSRSWRLRVKSTERRSPVAVPLRRRATLAAPTLSPCGMGGRVRVRVRTHRGTGCDPSISPTTTVCTGPALFVPFRLRVKSTERRSPVAVPPRRRATLAAPILSCSPPPPCGPCIPKLLAIHGSDAAKADGSAEGSATFGCTASGMIQSGPTGPPA